MRRLLLVALLLLAVAPLAHAGPRQVRGAWTAHGAVPDPSNQVGVVTGESNYTCGQQLATASQSAESRLVKATGKGTLVVTVSDFLGDWDLLVEDEKGNDIGASFRTNYGSPVTPQTDVAQARILRPGTYRMTACNFAGGDTAKVSWVLTYR